MLQNRYVAEKIIDLKNNLFFLKLNWPFWRITEHRDLAALNHALKLEFL